LSYAACLEDSSSRGGGRSELVIFTYSKPGNYTREQCNSVCFGLSHLYGGLGERHECLCSTNNEPNFISGSHCSAACTNRHVMTIFPEELSWKDARQQCLSRSGDLAVVRSDELCNLLARKVTQERGVWLGLSDVDSPGKLQWVNGSEALEGEEGQQHRSSISRGNVCVSFDQNGQTSSHLCDSKRAYVCQYNAQGMLTETL
ncbi:hypothetical protein GOODEAATRI_007201, partial [Goodea atripinnis]